MNKATKGIVTTFGVIFGISGISHGYFETLQGNTPTHGMFISAVGVAQRMWPHGNEPAFTVIPNFLVTGMAAMLVGLAIIIWSLGLIHKKNGPIILLLLFILLFLVGGGVAQILFFPWICLASTRINRPLTWWRKSIPVKIQVPLGKVWVMFLVLSSALLLLVFEIGITGFVPGSYNPITILSIMLGCLAAEVVLFPMAFISGFSNDLSVNPADIRVDR